MKRSTALGYAVEIARRVHAVNGDIATPECRHEGMRVARLWIFGSTAKGSALPNDLDLLIEWQPFGIRRKNSEAKRDEDYYRRYGIVTAASSEWDAKKWLAKGMKLVSRHDTQEDEIRDTVDVKKLIYPTYEMDFV